MDNVTEKTPDVAEGGLKNEFRGTIKGEIKSDPIILKLVRESEVALRDFVKKNNYRFDCIFYIENDFEIRDWQKIKLEVNFREDDLSSEKKLAIWDRLDDIIRKRINKLIKNSNEPEKKMIKDFNRKFFIEVNPI